MKKISAFIFILLISLSSLALFVEAAQRPRALPLPNNNRLMLPSAKPTVQVQLSHSPVLEDDDLEITIRARDDKGVNAISIASALLNQPIIENCQVNRRSPRTCEKTYSFRMPRGQQRFIITALDDENQPAVKTVNVNVLAVNEDIDVRVSGPQLTPEDVQDLPLELELLVTIEGVAKGRLCYRADYEFPIQDENGQNIQEGSLFDCEDSTIRTRMNNGQFSYQTELEIELFEPFGNFEGRPGEYRADLEVWLEDENGQRVEEDNEENNWFRFERVFEREDTCEERIEEARRQMGIARNDLKVIHARESHGRYDLQEATERNATPEEISELQQQLEDAMEETDDMREEEQHTREELQARQQECGIFENPDLVITNAYFVPSPTELGQPVIFEFEYENQGNAPVYGPDINAEFWFPERDDLGNWLPGGFNFATYLYQEDGVLEPGERGSKRIEAEAYWLRVPGTFSFNVGIDICSHFCWRDDYRQMPLLDNTIPELNEDNNLFTGQITVVNNG